MKKTKKIGIIVIFAVVLAIITIMDTILVFRMTAEQTKESGAYQIESISGELEQTIADAKNLTMSLALEAQTLLDNHDELETYIVDKKAELSSDTNGSCYNLYIAGKDWDIIPDLIKPEGFVASERDWYLGAVDNAGQAYVTTPYVDAWTGDICYSVSVMLNDGDTVLGVDYTLSNLKSYITEICENGASDAVIVTSDGIIASANDESYVTKNINDVLPDYAGIYSLAKENDDLVRLKIKKGITSENLFAIKCSSDWYLIVCENNWNLYKDSYMQLVFTIILNIGLFVIILLLYLNTRENQEKAEQALDAKEKFLSSISNELRGPLLKIQKLSDKESMKNSESYEEDLENVHSASEKLSGMIEQLISYSNIVKSEKIDGKANGRGKKDSKINKHYRIAIISLLIMVMIFSLYTNISSAYKWGEYRMRNAVNEYEDELSSWIGTQKSILDMFCSIFSNHPEMLDDYEGTVEYLNEITAQYPEISVTYMTNPNLEHTVYMNNGWEPDDDWHVEERQWYIDTENSPEHWSISKPYYDEQTGYYCVTVSETVYDAKTGEFLGNFGIDFYMDKLIDILGNSYSEDGYAFLVDADGEIINHPYGAYQMSVDSTTNVATLGYADMEADGKSTKMFVDYDGRLKFAMVLENEESGFKVYKVSNIWTIFSNTIIYGVSSLLVFLICIIIVSRLITALLHWQDDVNEQLQIAADEAIAAGNAKSKFLAQMSHEIRTPINAVLGMNEMVIRESDNPDIKEYAYNIQSSGKTLLSIINTILDFSKIEDGKMEIIPVEYDTASFINDLVNSISERAKSKMLEFNVHVDETLPAKLYGDDVRLTQIVSNLLTNAVKYTEKGSVDLSFAGKVEGSKLKLRVEVKDTGIGIREEDRDKLFESFQRLDEKRNRNIEGTGLGMSIVTKLLNMMDSKLELESEYGKGSTFWFEIEQTIVDGQNIGNYEQRLQRSESVVSEEYLYAPKAKLLVVDDNEMNLRVICGLLKRNGVNIDTASSGTNALELVKTQRYNIVFLDHMMPVMDGIETLQAMRQQQLLPSDTKVIALTANAIIGARETYLAAGFDDYLTKPIDITAVEKKLKEYLPSEFVEYRVAGDKATGSAAAGNNVAAAGNVVAGNNAVAAGNVVAGNNAVAAGNAVAGNAAAEENAGGFSLEELKNWRDRCPELNILAGLTYCMDDRSFYEEVISEFGKSDRREELAGYLEKEDYDNYKIAVHALKSNAKTIGAQVLSEHFRELEFAVKDDDIEFVKKHHGEVMDEYGKLLEAIV